MTKSHKVPGLHLQETTQYHQGLLQNKTATVSCLLQYPLTLPAHKISRATSATTVTCKQSILTTSSSPGWPLKTKVGYVASLLLLQLSRTVYLFICARHLSVADNSELG